MSNEDSSDEDEEIPCEEPKTIVGVTSVVDSKCRYFLGKDYSNSYEKDFEFIEKFDEGFFLFIENFYLFNSFFKDYIDRKCAPRMPWHDEALVVTGEAARDCARHFIQRWNIHKVCFIFPF
jgi:phospholipase D1/2